jgi:hypothetical protein
MFLMLLLLVTMMMIVLILLQYFCNLEMSCLSHIVTITATTTMNIAIVYLASDVGRRQAEGIFCIGICSTREQQADSW